MKPTKEQFEDFVRIRDSGVTNMFHVTTVCALSTTGLTKDLCRYIMTGDNFVNLAKEYEVEI